MGVSHTERTARFEALYDAHVRTVLRYALRRTDRDAAQDVVAETFLIAWRRLDQVPAETAPWLLAVARRSLANARRGDLRRSALVERLAGELAPGEQPAEPTDPVLAHALAHLSDDDRELLCLIAWEGLGQQEAARVLGCTGAVLRLRLHRARKRLAAALERERNGEPLIRKSTPVIRRSR